METLPEGATRSLKEHRAIKHGGWKLVGGIVMVLANLAILGICFASIWFDNDRSDSVSRLLARIVSLTMMSVFGTVLYSFLKRVPWLREYWRLSASGYVARFSRLGTIDHTGRQRWELVDDVATRRDANSWWRTSGEHAPISILLPLGGWFARPWILAHDRDQVDRLRGWSVKLRDIRDTGVVKVEVRYRNRRWGITERIVTDIGSALRHLECVATDALHHLYDGSWSDIVAHLVSEADEATCRRDALGRSLGTLNEALRGAMAESGSPIVILGSSLVDQIREGLRRLVAERDTAVKERDAARKGRDEAIESIGVIADKLEQADRLAQTLDGLRILERIRSWLCQAYTDADRPADALVKLALVRDKIVEKEKRDRRRHGRKGATPAAT